MATVEYLKAKNLNPTAQDERCINQLRTTCEQMPEGKEVECWLHRVHSRLLQALRSGDENLFEQANHANTLYIRIKTLFAAWKLANGIKVNMTEYLGISRCAMYKREEKLGLQEMEVEEDATLQDVLKASEPFRTALQRLGIDI